MQFNILPATIITLVLVFLIGAAGSIALDEFQDETTTDSFAYNITGNGLSGLDNTLQFGDTWGTIIGVSVLITIVIGAFAFGRTRAM